jgi:hypothetical protein
MIDEQTISKLKKLPLFNMSLSSKELFHSNFIAWMVEEYPKEMSELFTNLLEKNIEINLDTEKRGLVDREQRNKDLTISLENGKKIIIENKVKSLPDYDQLKKYSTDNKNTYYIILSLIKPAWLNDNNKKFKIENTNIEWLFINYKRLSEELDRLGIENLYVKDYIKFISLLSNFPNMISFKKTDKFEPIKYYEKFKEIRLHDIYQKLYFSLLLVELKKFLKDKNIDTQKFYMKVDFQSQTGRIAISYKEEKRLDNRFNLAVDLHSNSLSFFIGDLEKKNILKKINNKELIEKYFSFFTELNSNKSEKMKIYPLKENEYCNCNQFSNTYFYRRIKLTNKTINDILEILKNAIAHLEKYSRVLIEEFQLTSNKK